MKIKSTKSEIKQAILISLGFSFLGAASWLFNIGWLRLILTFTFVPVLMIILVFVANCLSFKYFKFSSNLKDLNTLFNLSYLFFWLLLPDYGDYGDPYMLFGLIKSRELTSIASPLASAFALLFAATFIIQMVQIAKLKKALSSSSVKPANQL